MERIAITELKAMKRRGEQFAMLTAYDYQTARYWMKPGCRSSWLAIRWEWSCWGTIPPFR